MKNRKKMMLFAAAVLSAAALFAGCTTASAVSLEEAKDLVLETAGAENAVVLELETDRDDGVYELELIVDGVRYEYEVDSRTGQVREAEQEDGRPVSAETTPVDAEKYITMEQARAIAYTHAGVDEEQAVDKSYDFDDGYYEIDFEYDGWDYEYDISNTGEILKSEKTPDDDRPAQTVPAETQAQRITLEEAKAIAYAHAGVSENEVYDKSYERDDGVYEIDFEHGGWDYEYEISRTGEILKSEKDADHDDHHNDDHHTSASQPAQSTRISAEEAWTIALNHAGLTADQIRDRDSEFDDGRWELSFESGRTEYEYHIAADGTILNWEKNTDN